MFEGQTATIQFLAQLLQQPVVVAVRTTVPPIHLEPTVVLAAVDHIRLQARLLHTPAAPEEAETLQALLHPKVQTAAQEMALCQTLEGAVVAALLLLEVPGHQLLGAQAVMEQHRLFLAHL